MRYKITVRGDNIELRGYIDGDEALRQFSNALDPNYQSKGIDAIIILTPVDEHYNPFALEDM